MSFAKATKDWSEEMPTPLNAKFLLTNIPPVDIHIPLIPLKMATTTDSSITSDLETEAC